GTLTVVPLLVVYLFALSFLSRGIESWFTKGLGRGLRAAVNESALVLEQRKQDQMRHTVGVASLLAGYSPDNLALSIDAERVAAGATELLVVTPRGQVLAASSTERTGGPDANFISVVLAQMRDAPAWSDLVADGSDGCVINTAAVLPPGREEGPRVLLARYQLESALSDIANAVLEANAVYANTTEEQSDLMHNFILTLTLVLLLAMLSAIYLGIRAARHLTKPV